MELLQLRYFQKVARMEHMTKAAEELRIAQPALSKTIAKLEEELGIPLFDRRNRQIQLNEYGRAFLMKVEEALNALEEGKREITDLAGMKKGRIAIATNALGRLSNPLKVFRENHPEVNFRIQQIAPSATEDMVELLHKGEVDMCFTAAPLNQPGIKEIGVLHADLHLAVPPGHWMEGREKITLEETAQELFIEYKEGHPFRAMNEELYRKAGIRPEIVCEVEEPSALMSLVQAGLGVALVPACRRDESPVAMLQIPGSRRTFTIASCENRYVSLAAREFQRFLIQYFQE
ncbi:LysR family transcriptional regulator [Paenibacillus sp. P96]|uniref:LysR family transcriptional regulator n=1 Tax=Paenibacillus zeirhizosphaerae TaxID=2987519 RepID=A0ABT9FUA4_9BACL|nr:LysR family transcriptional regulator [Paenibacillus sp. P96]MDP4098312.1 LysR family transcriptional regulator [Paenibacillus sp. P96]